MFGIDDALLGAVAGPLIGGLLGAGGSRGSSQTQTQDKSPWAPAQPWMIKNLETGQKLQDYYQKNPFNQQQQPGYQNLFGDIDNFRQNMAPGLMSFANDAMGSSYQRQRGGAPGSGAGYGGAVQSAGNRGTPANVFSAPSGQSYGLIDFKAQNPFTNGGIPANQVPTSAIDPNAEANLNQLFVEWLRRQGLLGSAGDAGQGGGPSGDDGSGGSGTSGSGQGGDGPGGGW